MDKHPTPGEWRDFLWLRSPGTAAEKAGLDLHLQACLRCRQELLRLPAPSYYACGRPIRMEEYAAVTSTALEALTDRVRRAAQGRLLLDPAEEAVLLVAGEETLPPFGWKLAASSTPWTLVQPVTKRKLTVVFAWREAETRPLPGWTASVLDSAWNESPDSWLGMAYAAAFLGLDPPASWAAGQTEEDWPAIGSHSRTLASRSLIQAAFRRHRSSPGWLAARPWRRLNSAPDALGRSWVNGLLGRREEFARFA